MTSRRAAQNRPGWTMVTRSGRQRRLDCHAPASQIRKTAEVRSSCHSTPRPMDTPCTALATDEENSEICTDHDFVCKPLRPLPRRRAHLRPPRGLRPRGRTMEQVSSARGADFVPDLMAAWLEEGQLIDGVAGRRAAAFRLVGGAGCMAAVHLGSW
jgi:hypothetical protein